MNYSEQDIKELIECMEAALKWEHERVRDMYKRAGGMFSWFGPEWPMKARKLIKKIVDEKPENRGYIVYMVNYDWKIVCIDLNIFPPILGPGNKAIAFDTEEQAREFVKKNKP